MIEISSFITKRLPAETEKRRLCLPVAENILVCSYLVRCESWLALESVTFEFPSTVQSKEVGTFFKKIVSWIGDGINRDDMTCLIHNVLSSKERTGTDLLSHLLVAEGLLAVIREKHPDYICELLLSWIGLELHDEVQAVKETALNRVKKLRRDMDHTFLEGLYSDPDRCKPPNPFDTCLTKLNEDSIRRLIKECDGDQLAEALLSCRRDNIEKIFDHMTDRLADNIKSTMRSVYSQTCPEGQKKAMESVLSLLER